MPFKCSPDTSYCVYSEMELLYNTGEMVFAAKMMNADLDEIHDHMDGHILANFSRQYHIWYDQIATPIEKSVIGYYFLHSIGSQLRDLSSMISHTLVDSLAKKNNICLPFSSKYTIQNPGSLSTLFNDKNIYEAIKAHNKEFITALIYGKLAVYTNNIQHTFAEAIKYWHDKFEIPQTEALFASFGGLYPSQNKESKKSKENSKKTIRRIFNKSLAGLKSFLGSSNTSAFISGNEVTIEGELFDYKLKKTMDLLKYTEFINGIHIPYDLAIYTKSGEYITKMCVVFPGSPVLDQVLSVYLMIKSGQERTLLTTGNFYGNRGDAYYDDYLFSTMFQTSRFNKNIKIDESSIDITKFSMHIAFSREVNDEDKEIVARSETFEKMCLDKYPDMKIKVAKRLLHGTGLPNVIKDALLGNSLSWDRMIDYHSIGLPVYGELDVLIDANNEFTSFNKLFVAIDYDFNTQSIIASKTAPKKVLTLI